MALASNRRLTRPEDRPDEDGEDAAGDGDRDGRDGCRGPAEGCEGHWFSFRSNIVSLSNIVRGHLLYQIQFENANIVRW
jgi:hypothetical protein